MDDTQNGAAPIPPDDGFERKVVTIAIDKDFIEATKKIDADGWKIEPGSQPYATYNLYRPKANAANSVEIPINFTCDDTKVGILRADGTHEAYDGTITRPDKSA